MTNITTTTIANTKKKVAVDERCKICLLKTYQRLFDKFDNNAIHRQKFIARYHEIIIANKYLSTPEIQAKLNHEFCRIVGIHDPFAQEKANSNYIALNLYKKWKPKVISAMNPFDLSLRLAIAGNFMDYGTNNDFDLNRTISDVLESSFAINHSNSLKIRLKQAKKILYLGDNAGEIVFDKLFIETNISNPVIYAVKNAPVLNDVTHADAQVVGMNLVAQVISIEFDAPSTVLEKCSKEFLDIYHEADLNISKGQGNFEGLVHQNDSRIFFLPMAKCEYISEILNINKGRFIVLNKTIT